MLVLVGVLLAPWLIALIAPGFEGEKREATTALVRILFPGAGLLVLSAWCLGVLNSHRRFFLSYVAPVVWNLAIIGALLCVRRTAPGVSSWPRSRRGDRWWAACSSSRCSFPPCSGCSAVSFPRPLHRLRRSGPSSQLRCRCSSGRGVVQISAYVDTVLASLLPTGAVAAVSYAQVLYTLPVSLFGMSVSAAELPEMSGATGSERSGRHICAAGSKPGCARSRSSWCRRPWRSWRWATWSPARCTSRANSRPEMTVYVWAILAAASVGLLPSTLGRLYSSAFYALHDTRTPLRIAFVRVGLGVVLGYGLALHLPSALGVDARWGAAGITLASGLAGGVEYLLLRRRAQPSGSASVRLEWGILMRLWVSAAGAACWRW